MSRFEIDGRMIGDGQPAYIIAELSANHAGSMERALEMIHAAKQAGADCVKIQTYTPDTMTIDCHNQYFNIEKGTWEGENLYSLYQKAYTPWEWQDKLRDEAAKVGIDFLSTAFDNTSVDFLEKLRIKFYKIASFELVDIPLLEYIASKNKPMILSTGMATLEEITEAVEAVYSTGNRQLALMKCSSAYPAKYEEMNLLTMSDMKRRFDVPVGLSDHSMGAFSATTAVAMGANIIEKHFCMSRAIKNPDSSFSMEPDEFRDMVEKVREVEKAKGGISYGVSKQEETNTGFRRSLFVVEDIAAGETLTSENVRSIRPAYGLKPKYYKEVLGKRAKHEIKRGTPLSFEDIDMGLWLRKATWEDMDLLYQWANDAEVRKNAFHMEKIPYEDHKKWFGKVMEDERIYQYILCDDAVPIGQIRLNIDEAVALISYSISAKYRGKGYGSKMLQLAEHQIAINKIPYVTKLVGQVKYENLASARVFEKCGYVKQEMSQYIQYEKQM